MPRQRIKAVLPNTQKQTQVGCRLRRQRNMAQMKEQVKPSKKGNKQNGDSQPIRCTVQNNGDKDARRSCWVQQMHNRINEG